MNLVKEMLREWSEITIFWKNIVEFSIATKGWVIMCKKTLVTLCGKQFF
jgi:hypothetical protein